MIALPHVMRVVDILRTNLYWMFLRERVHLTDSHESLDGIVPNY